VHGPDLSHKLDHELSKRRNGTRSRNLSYGQQTEPCFIARDDDAGCGIGSTAAFGVETSETSACANQTNSELI
jgi:hypothetical protein